MGNVQCSSLPATEVMNRLRGQCVNGPTFAQRMIPPERNKCSVILFGETHFTAHDPTCPQLGRVLHEALNVPSDRKKCRPVALFIEDDYDSSRAPTRHLDRREVDLGRQRKVFNRVRAEQKKAELLGRPKRFLFYRADLLGAVRDTPVSAIGRADVSADEVRRACRACVLRIAEIGRVIPVPAGSERQHPYEYLSDVIRQFELLCQRWEQQGQVFIARVHSLQTELSAQTSDRSRRRTAVAFMHLSSLMTLITDCMAVRAMWKVGTKARLTLGYWGEAHVNNQCGLLNALGYEYGERIDTTEGRPRPLDLQRLGSQAFGRG